MCRECRAVGLCMNLSDGLSPLYLFTREDSSGPCLRSSRAPSRWTYFIQFVLGEIQANCSKSHSWKGWIKTQDPKCLWSIIPENMNALSELCHVQKLFLPWCEVKRWSLLCLALISLGPSVSQVSVRGSSMFWFPWRWGISTCCLSGLVMTWHRRAV